MDIIKHIKNSLKKLDRPETEDKYYNKSASFIRSDKHNELRKIREKFGTNPEF